MKKDSLSRRAALSAGGAGILSLVFSRQLDWLGTYKVRGGCDTTVVQTNFDLPGKIRGITLPVPGDSGDSVILVNDGHDVWAINHERGHAEQICEEGFGAFVVNYFKDMDAYEQNANQRMPRLEASQ